MVGNSKNNSFGKIKAFFAEVKAVRPETLRFTLAEFKEYIEYDSTVGNTAAASYLSILTKTKYVRKVVTGTYTILNDIPEDLTYYELYNDYKRAVARDKLERKVQREKDEQKRKELLATETVGSALDVQIGGSHYKSMDMQPIEVIIPLNFSFVQGNILKYISRYENKNGIEDIKKCIHYAKLAKEFEAKGDIIVKTKNKKVRSAIVAETIDEYCVRNKIRGHAQYVINFLSVNNWDRVIEGCERLIAELTSANDAESLL